MCLSLFFCIFLKFQDISDEAKDLVGKLLQKEPQKRLPLEQAGFTERENATFYPTVPPFRRNVFVLFCFTPVPYFARHREWGQTGSYREKSAIGALNHCVARAYFLFLSPLS